MKMLRASWKRVVKFGGMVLLLLVVMDLNSRMVQMYSLQGEMEAEYARVQELEAVEDQLDEQIAYASSDDIVAEWARSHNWMQKEGDFVIALVPTGERPPETLTESFQAEPELDNWDAWLLWLTYRE
ncbi:MAG: septum formation initiator family protein [Anaerolineales bacterium]